jgi:hypothetical protein
MNWTCEAVHLYKMILAPFSIISCEAQNIRIVTITLKLYINNSTWKACNMLNISK